MSPTAEPTIKTLQHVARQHPPSGFPNYMEFLKALHAETKDKLKRYSYRQLSEDLGFSHTNVVHLFAQGKRPISAQAADRIVESLALPQLESDYFRAMVKTRCGKDAAEVEQGIEESVRLKKRLLSKSIESDQLRYYSEYHHPVIRELVGLPHFESDPKWIAAQVFPKITSKQAEESLKLLETLGMIQLDKKTGRYQQTDQLVATDESVSVQKNLGVFVRNYHKEAIPMGIEALATLPVEERHISALTLQVNSEKLAVIRREIEMFQQRLLEIEKKSKGGDHDRVVQLNMQLFPATKEKK